MARMYPNVLDGSTLSAAERRLYEAFRDQLSHEYVVFHHVSWHGLDRHDHPRDGEADFIVAHAERGILVMEVKGGGINYDPRSGEWTTRNGNGVIEWIRNPVEQVKDSKYTLLNLLKKDIERYVWIGHALAFPDVVVDTEDMRIPQLQRTFVMDANDMGRIGNWIEEALAYWCGRGTERLGQDGLATLINLLGRQLEWQPTLWGRFTAEREQLGQLTRDQYTLLDCLSQQRQLKMCGFAGSGKTWIALEKAKRLASQGLRVLFTCRHPDLLEELGRRLKGFSGLECLDLYTFEELANRLVIQTGIRLPELSAQPSQWYTHALPQALLEALGDFEPRYDAIIVDEGETFCDQWWTPLQLLLKDPAHDHFYVFYDDHRYICTQSPNLPLETLPYLLTVSCRHTQAIQRQLLRFYAGAITPLLRGPEGLPVEVYNYDRQERLHELLLTRLKSFTEQEKIPAREIVVVTPFTQRRSYLQVERTVSRFGLSQTPAAGQIRLASLQSFKGLERSVVVLVELERWLAMGGVSEQELIDQLYSACSLARNYLLVCLHKSAPERLRSLFA